MVMMRSSKIPAEWGESAFDFVLNAFLSCDILLGTKPNAKIPLRPFLEVVVELLD